MLMIQSYHQAVIATSNSQVVPADVDTVTIIPQTKSLSLLPHTTYTSVEYEISFSFSIPIQADYRYPQRQKLYTFSNSSPKGLEILGFRLVRDVTKLLSRTMRVRNEISRSTWLRSRINLSYTTRFIERFMCVSPHLYLSGDTLTCILKHCRAPTHGIEHE